MIAYLALGFLLLIVLILLARLIVSLPPRTLLTVVKVVGAILVAAGAGFLIISGRWALLVPLAVAASALARLLWTLQGAGGFWGGVGPSGAGHGGWRNVGTGKRDQTSDVRSAYLHMTLDHETGAMGGTVIDGAFAGRRLDELSKVELMALLKEVRVADADGARLLEAWLDRTFGQQWHGWASADDEQTAGEARNEKTGDGRRGGGRGGRSAMTVDEAREILGVGPDATAEEIKAAHRRLMQKLHPDRGGSSYLAAQINQARDVLLANQA